MSRAQRRREVGVGARRDSRYAPTLQPLQQFRVTQYKVQAYELSSLPGSFAVVPATQSWRLVQDVGPLNSLADAERIFTQMCSVQSPLARRIVKLFRKNFLGGWVVARQCGA